MTSKIEPGGDTAGFVGITEPYRRELLAHCYRMLGSVSDAEDLVQETYLRAWRAFDTYSGVSPVRSWLYKIATNACLTEVARRGRMVLPSGLSEPSTDWRPGPVVRTATGWLSPIPDALAVEDAADPAAILATRETLRLALVASLQYLPAQQRAVLILKDVLMFSTAETADILGTTPASVKSALQRARARLDQVGPTPDTVAELDIAEQTAMVDRYLAAFERADIAALERLLVDDVTLEATPLRAWFAGKATCVPYLARHVLGVAGDWRMVPTRANGTAALAVYRRGLGSGYDAYGILHLDVGRTGISRLVSFGDPGLLPYFGFPPHLSPDQRPARAGSGQR